MITRRRTLQSVLASLPAAFTLSSSASQTSGNGVFQHGVASGDPGPDSIVLWTQLTTGRPHANVRWDVAQSSDFRTILASGSITTTAERDYTVKAVASDLPPGTRLFYRFIFDGASSHIGRIRTLPTDSLDQLGIALVSCANHAFGYFNAYDTIARDPAIDYVLHTGDYLYEHGSDGWGSETANRLQRQHQPPHEIITLADYRLRHAQYKRDFAAQATRSSPVHRPVG